MTETWPEVRLVSQILAAVPDLRGIYDDEFAQVGAAASLTFFDKPLMAWIEAQTTSSDPCGGDQLAVLFGVLEQALGSPDMAERRLVTYMIVRGFLVAPLVVGAIEQYGGLVLRQALATARAYVGLIDEMLLALPELHLAVQAERDLWQDTELGPIYIYEQCLAPAILEWLRPGAQPDSLRRAFTLIEDILRRDDSAAHEVVAHLCLTLDRDPKWVELALPWLGSATQEFVRSRHLGPPSALTALMKAARRGARHPKQAETGDSSSI